MVFLVEVKDPEVSTNTLYSSTFIVSFINLFVHYFSLEEVK